MILSYLPSTEQPARRARPAGRGVLVPQSHGQVLCGEAVLGAGQPPQVSEAQAAQGQNGVLHHPLCREGTRCTPQAASVPGSSGGMLRVGAPWEWQNPKASAVNQIPSKLFMVCLSVCNGQDTMVARQFFLIQILNPSCCTLNPTGRANQNGSDQYTRFGAEQQSPFPWPWVCHRPPARSGDSVTVSPLSLLTPPLHHHHSRILMYRTVPCDSRGSWIM